MGPRPWSCDMPGTRLFMEDQEVTPSKDGIPETKRSGARYAATAKSSVASAMAGYGVRRREI